MTTLTEANATLDQALRELGVLTPKADAVHWLLGLVYGESKFGTSPDWVNPDPNGYNTETSNPGLPPGPSHNWGAVRHHQAGTRHFFHGDRQADGSPGVFKFQWYPSAVEGAKGFLRTLLRGQVPAVLQATDTGPYDLAKAMYANHYFTGTQGSAEDRIQAYGNMVKNLADKVRKELGSTPMLPFDPSRPVLPIPSSTTVSNVAKGSWALGALIGIGYLAWRYRR